MRSIDPHLIPPDSAWDGQSIAAQVAVKLGGKVEDHGAVWRASKDRLKVVSHGKCWYCESREDRSDDAVDHFRPKSLYPWLAFSISNFRYACTFCNSIRVDSETGISGGKGNHFPLLAGTRATNEAGLPTENPVLIDPCRGGDPGLLDFHADGSVCPRYPAHPTRSYRAVESIKYYHLHHSDLVEARRTLALQIVDWIAGGDAVYNETDQGTTSSERAFSMFVESISRAIDPHAPFSVFARRVVDGYSNKPWVYDLLRT